MKFSYFPYCFFISQISGQFVNIQDALYHVTSRLRNNLFTSKTTNTSGSGNGKLISDTTIHGSVRDMTPSSLHHSSMTSMSINGQATLRQGLDPSLRPHVSEHSPSVGLRTSEVRDLLYFLFSLALCSLRLSALMMYFFSSFILQYKVLLCKMMLD